jgi:hypothetical protein
MIAVMLGITYALPIIIRIIKSRRMKWVRHVAYTGEKRSTCRFLVKTPEGKRPLGRRKHSWKSSIKRDLRGTGWNE